MNFCCSQVAACWRPRPVIHAASVSHLLASRLGDRLALVVEVVGHLLLDDLGEDQRALRVARIDRAAASLAMRSRSSTKPKFLAGRARSTRRPSWWQRAQCLSSMSKAARAAGSAGGWISCAAADDGAARPRPSATTRAGKAARAFLVDIPGCGPEPVPIPSRPLRRLLSCPTWWVLQWCHSTRAGLNPIPAGGRWREWQRTGARALGVRVTKDDETARRSGPKRRGRVKDASADHTLSSRPTPALSRESRGRARTRSVALTYLHRLVLVGISEWVPCLRRTQPSNPSVLSRRGVRCGAHGMTTVGPHPRVFAVPANPKHGSGAAQIQEGPTREVRAAGANGASAQRKYFFQEPPGLAPRPPAHGV